MSTQNQEMSNEHEILYEMADQDLPTRSRQMQVKNLNPSLQAALDLALDLYAWLPTLKESGRAPAATDADVASLLTSLRRAWVLRTVQQFCKQTPHYEYTASLLLIHPAAHLSISPFIFNISNYVFVICNNKLMY